MWFPWPNGLDTFWAAYAGPVLAFGVSLLAVALGRLTRGRWLPAAVGVLVGWAVLVPVQALGVALITPRTPVDFLLLPVLLTLVAGLLPGRLGRWAPVLVVVAAGWWLAGSPAAGRQFWRVWAAVALAAWLLSRAVRQEPGRGVAAALTLWGGLVVAGAPPVWGVVSLVLLAAALALLAGRAALPPVLVAVAGAAACLGSGRMARGGFGAVDAAVLLVIAAPVLVPVLRARMGRLGRAGPVLAVPASAALAVAGAWCVVRLLRA